MAEGVKLLGHWTSPFVLRVVWALQLKGIIYDYIEEDFSNKSPLLLQYNPIHQKVPVLVHNGKPVVESLVILEYIEESWTQHPLLPKDPYERSKARFWSKFADDKCIKSILATFHTFGEEKEKAVIEARENLRTVEDGLEGKPFFGGEKIGFVDVAAGWIPYWAQIIEDIVDVKLIDDQTTPLLNAWFRNVLQDPVIKECTPSRKKLLQHFRGFHKKVMGNSV